MKAEDLRHFMREGTYAPSASCYDIVASRVTVRLKPNSVGSSSTDMADLVMCGARVVLLVRTSDLDRCSVHLLIRVCRWVVASLCR